MWAWLLACAPAPTGVDAGLTGCDSIATWYPDADGDGFGAEDGVPTQACAAPIGQVANAGDCDDTDPARFPGNDDPCDGIDNNCDGVLDPVDSRGFRDLDGDGAGDGASPIDVCDLLTPAAANSWDCDDADRSIPVFVSAGAAADGTGALAAPLRGLDEALHTDVACIRLLPGTYPTAVTFRGRDVDVASTDGPELTVLEGTTEDSVVTIWAGETRATVLEGFTLRGGGGKSTYAKWEDEGVIYDADIRYGGGLLVDGASPTLRSLSVVDNVLPDATRDDGGSPVLLTQSQGAGLFLQNGAPLLEDLVVDRNQATYGAAVYVGFDADVTLRRVRIAENASDYGNVYVAWGSLTAANLLLDANRSNLGYDGMLVFYGSVDLANSTVVDHSLGLTTWGASSITVRSSIFYGNGTGVADDGVVASTWLLAYDDIYGNTTDTENLPVTDPEPVGADPEFVSYTPDGLWNDDLGLSAGSPCRDAGDPASTDPDGTRADVGVTGGPFAP